MNEVVIKELGFAIADCQRFSERTVGYLDESKRGQLTEADLKLIRRHSLDVTHAMAALRAAIEATPEPITTVQPAEA